MEEVTKNINLNDVQNLVNKVNGFDITKIDSAKLKEFIFKDQKRACIFYFLLTLIDVILISLTHVLKNI